MNRMIALILCAVLTVSLFGCGKETGSYTPTGQGYYVEGQEITEDGSDEDKAMQPLVLAYYENESLNPFKTVHYINRTLFSLLYQGLFAVDKNYQTEPILCRRFVMSDDMHTYTFYLEDATFSDGSRVTAADVIASYEAALKSRVYGGRFSHVYNIALSEDGGVVFSLDTAMENLPILLDVPIVKAEEVDADRPVGSGPYYYEDAAAGLRLRRRGDWWCSADLMVTANSVPLRPVSSVLEVRDEFEFSDVSLALSDPCSDSYAEYRCDYELWDCENGIMLYLGCNADSKVFSNTTIRSALTHLIDRQSIVDTFYRGFAQPASLPASPSSPYYSTPLAQRFAFDQQKFVQAIAETGYIGLEVEFLVNQDDSLRLKVAKQIAQALTDCGLRVTMVEVSNSVYQQKLLYGMYDLYLGQTRLSANMDLSPFFRASGNLRHGGMTDPAIYAMCQQALANSGNYYNLLETVMEDGRLCPILFHTYSVHATRGMLTGLTPARDNVFYYSLGKTMADAITAQ